MHGDAYVQLLDLGPRLQGQLVYDLQSEVRHAVDVTMPRLHAKLLVRSSRRGFGA